MRKRGKSEGRDECEEEGERKRKEVRECEEREDGKK